MGTDPWRLLLHGPNDKAICQIRKAYEKEPDASHIMETGVAYLWVKAYQKAWEHFEAVNRKAPRHADCYYGMAGVAKWCLGEPEEAVRQWREALRCQYADGAGGIGSRLWVYVASVIKPRLMDGKEAIELLTRQTNDRRVEYWPGPIAEFVLGRIDESEMRTRGATSGGDETYMANWLSDFYVGIVDRANRKIARFKKAMCRVAATSDDDFDVANPNYLSKLWHVEFFIARHEAGVETKAGSHLNY